MDQIKSVLKSIAAEMSVLYAEDDDALRTVFTESLGKFFKEVDSVENGAIALQKYRSKNYDLVITDIMMPELDGLLLAKEIKNTNPEQKIAVISAYSDSDRLLEFINLGVDGFLVKPIQNETLINLLYKIVRQLRDSRLALEYEGKLLALNSELEAKVKALDRAIKALLKAQNLAITAINKKEDASEHIKIRPKRVISAKEFIDIQPFSAESKINILEDIEDELDIMINRIKTGSVSSFEELSSVVKRYADVINSFEEFSNVAFGLNELANTVTRYEGSSLDQKVIDIFFSIADNLENFRVSIFVDKSANDIHYLDDSLIADITLLERMLAGTSEENISEMELF